MFLFPLQPTAEKFCSDNFEFSTQTNSSVIREWTLHLIVLLDKVTVETGINYPKQRVFWSDFSLYTPPKYFFKDFFLQDNITYSCKQ